MINLYAADFWKPMSQQENGTWKGPHDTRPKYIDAYKRMCEQGAQFDIRGDINPFVLPSTDETEG